MEMRAHSLAAGLTCWAAGPHTCGSKVPPPPLLSDLKSGNFSGLAQLIYWKESGCDWKRYYDIKYVHGDK